MEQNKQPEQDMPILRAMEQYLSRSVYPLHTPGHKGGRSIAPDFAKLLGSRALAIDVSLMGEELGNLHLPSGCIQASQELAAELYGAARTYFCVNGSSGALQAMLLGALEPGDTLIAARNMHCSAMTALILAEIQTVFINNPLIAEFGIAGQITPQQVRAALQAHPKAKAVFITSPTYHGIVADVAGIVRVAEEYGAMVLVDEAHGAHLYFSELLPAGALHYDVAAAVQSTHKTLSSLTQTSMFHVRLRNKYGRRMGQMHSLLTSTSPNYLLLASLDAAAYLMRTQGRELMEKAYVLAERLRCQLKAIKGLRVLSQADLADGDLLDPTKVLINVRELGYTGTQVAAYLLEHGYNPELADDGNVLFLLTYAEDAAELDRLVQLLRMLPPKMSNNTVTLPVLQIPIRRLSIHQAYYAQWESIPRAEAIGRTVAESIVFYPPGIATLLPGEVFTAQCAEYCSQMLALGVSLTGCADPTLQAIRVIKEEL